MNWKKKRLHLPHSKGREREKERKRDRWKRSKSSSKTSPTVWIRPSSVLCRRKPFCAPPNAATTSGNREKGFSRYDHPFGKSFRASIVRRPKRRSNDDSTDRRPEKYSLSHTLSFLRIRARCRRKQCIQNCTLEMQQKEAMVNNELQVFQEKVQRCAQTCNDKAQSFVESQGMDVAQRKAMECIDECARDYGKELGSIKRRVT